MTLSFAYACIVAGAILVSFIGLGWLATAAIFRLPHLDWSLNGGIGMASAALVGGVLNAVAATSRVTVSVLFTLGLAAFALHLALLVKRKRFATNPIHSGNLWRLPYGALLLCAILIGTKLLTSAATFEFNSNDDFKAYLVFPQMMLDTGSAIDPFSARRLTSALGGKSFLDAIPLALLSPQNLRIIDGFVAFTLLLGAVLFTYTEHASNAEMGEQDYRFGAYLLVGVFSLLAVVDSKVQLNISAATSGTLLLFIAAQRLARMATNRDLQASAAILLGAIVAALCALKSTFVFPCVILLALYYGAVLARHPRRFLQPVLLGTSVCVFLIPWMLALWQSSHTLLYPILGKGTYSIQEDLAPLDGLAVHRLIRELPSGLALAIPPFLAMYAARIPLTLFRADGKFLAYAALAWSGPLTMVAISLATAGDSVFRYGYPVAFAISLSTIVLCLPKLVPMLRWASMPLLAQGLAITVTVVCVGIACAKFLSYGARPSGYHAQGYPRELNLQDAPLAAMDVQKSYERLQQALPPGSAVLVRLSKPFLLDFRRNTIFAADLPCISSLPPGMPCPGGAIAVARYLRAKGIMYIAYEYATEAYYPESKFWPHVDPSQFPSTVATTARYAFSFNRTLAALYRAGPKLYDDGTMALFGVVPPAGID